MPRERWDDHDAEERTREMPRAERRTVEQRPVRRQPPPDDRALWPWLLLLLALVLAGLAALYYFSQREEPPEEPELVTVPAVVRLPSDDAVTELQQAGFGVSVTREADEAPEGIVFAQAPGAGRRLERGATVEIFVSEGPNTTAVPSVVGLPEDQARERLESAELEAAVEGVFSEEPEGVVVSQAPQAGEEVARGSNVRLEVSQGPGTTTVPDVVGTDVEQAEAELEEASLRANVVRVPSNEPEGTVVAQNPQGGAEAPVDSQVRLNVSAGG